MELTNHVIQRYAERVADKEQKDVHVFIAQNEDRIREWILKLYENSEYVCGGKIKDHGFSHFNINSDGWVFVVDNKREKIITLYKVDLELGTEFNKEYIKRMIEKIKNQYDVVQNNELTMLERRDEIGGIISQNNDEIARLKKDIEYLNSANELLSKERVTRTHELEKITRNFNKIIETFLGAKVFEI